MEPWRFWIDVGGTFTDCLACSPAGELQFCKVLSSGAVRAEVAARAEGGWWVMPALAGRPEDLFAGYRVRRVGEKLPGQEVSILHSRGSDGAIRLAAGAAADWAVGARLELSAGEPAPILAVRLLWGKRLDEPLAGAELRLGTTRGTNALLERRGAPTAFITTAGFGDALRIGHQDRPRLFDLRIVKPPPLYERVIEIDERMAADGTVLHAFGRDQARASLRRLRSEGVGAVAICFLNAYQNPAHEAEAAELARELGFDQVSVSSEISPTIKFIARGDTTVVDAYLGPVIRDYVRSILERLPRGSLRLMTSAGGLAEAAACGGKDLILSGPAGGVVGFSAAARRAGWDRAVGFDMGGTSTDVSRYDGEFVYEYETVKAGVRVVAPMLAIETVAAGGGSICDFDGQKLTVGPRSAGAEPGPACYGGGGPLAVTDLNVFLGRLPTDRFPFELDEGAVRRRMDELRRRVEAGTGRRLSRIALAEGLTRIANANMAAAIKKISVARGYDVREYGLVAFGGAAGQHVCAVCRDLGVRRALVPPLVGVLSAFGLGMADVKKFEVMNVLRELTPATLRGLEDPLAAMEHQLGEAIVAEGIPPERLGSPRRLYDLRYRGQSAVITVEFPPDGDLIGAFEGLHRRLYGHAHEGRPVEIVAARVERVGALPHPELPASEERPGRPEPAAWTRTVFGGRRRATAIYERDRLRAGDRLAGPALIVEATTTTVLEPGWEARVTGRGELMLEDVRRRRREIGATEADPIRLEIFHNHFAAIAEQMGETLRRTALSVNVKERLDFSCAVFTASGELVANAPHMPVHLGAMGETVRRVRRAVADLGPGDVVVSNDPYLGGSHLPDVTAVTPVFEGSGDRILFFTASRAHHAEIGGLRPGSMPPDSTRLIEEGVVIRNFKVIERGRPRFDELRRLLTAGAYPSRTPEENLADVAAQVAANQAGVLALGALVERYGLSVVEAYMGHIQRAAEAKMRAALARRPEGVYTFEDALDDGSSIRVRVELRGETARLDFGGSARVSPGNLNANPAIVRAAVIYCLRCLIEEDIPLNEGVLAPVEIVIPPGLLNSPSDEDPARCAAVAGGNVETSQRLVDVIFGALGMVAASQGTMNNVSFGDGRFGYYETICGGSGAGPGFDGADAVHTHMTNTRLTDPEVLEAQFPVRLKRFEIRRGSGGTGRWRGGEGARRELEFLAPLEVAVLSTRRLRRPFGLAGGGPGAAGRNLLARHGGDWAELPPTVAVQVGPGDRLLIETPGGGGYGSLLHVLEKAGQR